MLAYQLAFVGAGNMAAAILSGALRQSAVLPENVILANPHLEKLEGFRAQGVRVTTSNEEAANQAGLIVLAVKPQMFDAVLPQLAPYTSGKCVVSIAAGISLAYLQSRLLGAHVMRAMPNTPLLLGKGITALAKPLDFPEEYWYAVEELFSAAGQTILVDENRLNAVIALSGSSPAYFFRLIAAMAAQGEAMGLEYGQSAKLAAGAMEGAAAMLLHSGKSPLELTQQVCSPGGTTLAALSAFDDGDLEAMVADAMTRCVIRAEELGR